MNISGENSTKLANVRTICVEFTPTDYAEKYQKELKEAARHLELPGFRRGHVPTSLINKKYGSELLRGVIQKMSEKAVNDYIQKENLLIIGGIFPSEKQETYEIVPNEPCSFFFDLLVVPPLSLPADMKVTAARPVFDAAYWERFDRKLSHQIQSMQEDATLGESMYLGLRFEVLSTTEESEAKEEASDNWRVRSYFPVLWDELPEAIRTQLIGKKVQERTVFAADLYDLLASFIVLAEQKDAPLVREEVKKNGFALVAEYAFTYTNKEVTKEHLLLYTPQHVDEVSKLSEKEVLQLVHEFEETKIQLACKVVGIREQIDAIAREWQFDVPIEMVHFTLLQSGMAEDALAFFTPYQRGVLRTEGFMNRIATDLEEKYKSLAEDENLSLVRMVIAFDILMNEPSTYMMRLLPPMQKLDMLFEHRKKDQRFDESFHRVMECILLAETLFAQAEVTYRDEKIENFCWLEGVVGLKHARFDFKISKEEEEENRNLMMRSMGKAVNSEDTQAESESQEQEENGDK